MGLDELRGQVNACDEELLLLLKNRMDVCLKIGQYKKENGIQVLQVDRFNELQQVWSDRAVEIGLNRDFSKQMFELIHDESVRLQQSIQEK